MTVVVWTQEIERCCGGCCIRVAVAQRQCYFNLTEKRKHVARLRCGHGSVFSLSEERESECNLLQSVCLTSRRNLRTTIDHMRDEQSRVPRLLDYLTSETKEGRRHTVDSNPIVVRPLEINQFRGRCVNSVQ
ncbi:hypothetical protein ALC56_08727 [Trachymyrmex septentrionalis]|uniref:Uncharacterized protein n=1 Tax=Trachymyrmex septentrionalis TaxID=34720 RepID=A0A195F980_9HYME|nr:hypothetical protein ALC56_08727 [Trachymyrmex septentrionalis]